MRVYFERDSMWILINKKHAQMEKNVEVSQSKYPHGCTNGLEKNFHDCGLTLEDYIQNALLHSLINIDIHFTNKYDRRKKKNNHLDQV